MVKAKSYIDDEMWDMVQKAFLGAVGGVNVAIGGKYYAGAAGEIEDGIDAVKGAGGAKTVETLYGPAIQDISDEALGVRHYVEQGGDLYRGGTLGRSNTTDAQFWATESPLSPGYADKYGVDFDSLDYVIKGSIKPGTNFVTRPAPGLGNNAGGAIEVVTPPNSVDLDYFHMLGGK